MYKKPTQWKFSCKLESKYIILPAAVCLSFLALFRQAAVLALFFLLFAARASETGRSKSAISKVFIANF